MVKGSSNAEFRSECTRIMGLDGEENLAEGFEATLACRLNNIVDGLGHRAPASRRQTDRSAAQRGASAGDENMEDEGQEIGSETQNEDSMMETEGDVDDGQMESDRSGTIWDFL